MLRRRLFATGVSAGFPAVIAQFLLRVFASRSDATLPGCKHRRSAETAANGAGKHGVKSPLLVWFSAADAEKPAEMEPRERARRLAAAIRMIEHFATATSDAAIALAAIWPRATGAGCLAAVDWMAMGLWAGATLVAATLLGSAMNRRRQALSQTLKDHVIKTIGPPAGETENEEDGNETAA